MQYKYQIGDTLTSLIGAKMVTSGIDVIEEEIRADPEHRVREVERFVVLERQSTECSGGTQLRYLCRYRLADASLGTVWLDDIEVKPYPTEALWAIWKKVIAEEK